MSGAILGLALSATIMIVCFMALILTKLDLLNEKLENLNSRFVGIRVDLDSIKEQTYEMSNNAEAIEDILERNYDVTFTVTSKVDTESE